MTPNTIRNKNIRWIILIVLNALAKQGATEAGGWVREQVVRRLVAAEGYPLDINELRVFFAYLGDEDIACLEQKNFGTRVDPDYRIKLTAIGQRVAEGEVFAQGVGASEDD